MFRHIEGLVWYYRTKKQGQKTVENSKHEAIGTSLFDLSREEENIGREVLKTFQ